MHARAIPSITISGALSPPIASIAIVIRWLKPGPCSIALDQFYCVTSDPRCLNHFPVIIIATRRTHMVRAFELTTIITFDVGRTAEGIMRSAHVPLRFGRLFLGYCHCFLSQKLACSRERRKSGWILNEDCYNRQATYTVARAEISLDSTETNVFV